jgi:hypothetical protein
MSTQPKRPSRSLPQSINLQHLKDQAKALRKAGRAKSTAEAQFQIAREYGFPNWSKLKSHFESGSPALLRSEPVLPVANMRISRQW